MMEQFRKASTGPVAAVMEKVFDESGMREALQSQKSAEGESKAGAVENVEELIKSAAEYDRLSEDQEESGLVDYLQQIALFSDTDTYDPAGGKVSLMTLHSAKGLEFDNVFIIGLEEGLLPHERSMDNEKELEEERRLFFVGATRARAGLQISMARYRTVRGQTLRTIPSRFLYDVDVAVEEVRDAEYEDNEDKDWPGSDEEKNENVAKFGIEQLVRHKKFGLGRVQKYLDIGSDSVVVVKFNTGQTKSLMVKYAKLEKVE
ncbi:unnamed protein product [marine sediment metagenome]|uniref:UvrD-like helicase C-terminal domain-containing protein n=1 Tax=marine sediment metagenome TaxID=412755 RepID=X0ZJT8_9ZZZZ